MTDQEIIHLYWERNEDAISETASKYGSYLHKIANNILNNFEDSEECVNDTYNKAWNSIPPTKPNSLSAFLAKITRNLSINRYKEYRAKKRGENNTDLILDEIGEIASKNDNTEDQAIEQALIKAINDFLADLPTDKRIMFVRRYWYADDLKQIAKRLHTGENYISVTLKRIRAKLNGYLIERGFDI
jgi:RNA polymerase sigma-70 factor (ECF subfamily)